MQESGNVEKEAESLGDICSRFGITVDDIDAALQAIPSYIDVSKEDLAVIYGIAFQHAAEREKQPAPPHSAPSRVRDNLREAIWSGIGGLLGISICGILSALFFEPRALTLLIGSFGASAVLLFGAERSPLAQPRNLIGGHFLSALAGVAAASLLGGFPWAAAAVAVAVSITLMLLTRTLHPPGGATALIAVIGGEGIRSLGFLYAFVPVTAGALVLLIIAVAMNNLSPHRSYPEHWW